MTESSRLLNQADRRVIDASVHPHLRGLLSELTFTTNGTPDPESWALFIVAIDRCYRDLEAGSDHPVQASRGWSAFENLFQMSPIPLMQQDYSELVEWMAALRNDGVTDFLEYLGDDIDAIKSVVPMIKMVAANPAAIEAVGIPVEEFTGPVDPKIVNEGSLPGWRSQLDAIWNGIPHSRASFQAATTSGRFFDAESILSAPVVGGEPDFSRAVLTLIDVTDHRNEERRILELMEAKNSFLASVSHEIRTPLTAIVGFAQLLGDEEAGLGDEDRQLMVSSIAQQAEEVSNLVEDLLVVARNELAEVDIVETTVNLVDQLEQTLEAGGSFTNKVEIESQVDVPEVLGDPGRIRQILRNLLTNAERYGGPDVTVLITGAGESIVVSVNDNGLGIPAAEWERIFEPYHRAHKSVSRPESVGIGLAISRQLAERMGGTLDYRHENGLSVFSLTLPSAQPRS